MRGGYIKDEPGTCAEKDGSCQSQARGILLVKDRLISSSKGIITTIDQNTSNI